MAAEGGDRDIVGLLVEGEADIKSKDKNGVSVRDYTTRGQVVTAGLISLLPVYILTHVVVYNM